MEEKKGEDSNEKKGSSSSDSDSDVVVKRKKRKILESDSESSTEIELKSDNLDDLDRKPVKSVVEGVVFFKCPHCTHKTKSEGKTYSHMGEKHGMKKFECSYCHFSTRNKTSMHNHKKRYCRELNAENADEKPEADTTVMPKPVKKKIEGEYFFTCSICDYMAKSGGKIDGHMVNFHGYEKLVCEYCKFSTANSTSMHNHKRLYCRALKK